MNITWKAKFADTKALFDFVYNNLKALEAGGVAAWLKPYTPGGTSGITIGVGFDLKKITPAGRLAVLQAMGLRTSLWGKDKATLSASEKIESNYLDSLYNAVQGSSIAVVNAIMKKRATDTALQSAMTVENK